MTTVQITDVRITEDAQRAEILAGRDGSRVRTLTVSPDDPAWSDVVALGDVRQDGDVELSARRWHVYSGRSEALSPSEWDHVPSAAEIVEAHRASRATWEADRQATADAIRTEALAVLAERRTRNSGTRYEYAGEGTGSRSDCWTEVLPDWPCDAPADVRESPEALAWAEDLQRENERRRAEAQARAEALVAEHLAEVAAQEADDAARRDACGAVVRQIGTPDQIGRLDDGLLPQSEAEQIVRDYLYRPLADFARYVRIEVGDIDHADDCSYHSREDAGDAPGITCTVNDADDCPAGPWSALRAIRAAMPEATCTMRRHWCVCNDARCRRHRVRYSVRVALEWSGRTLTREYAAD